MHKIQKLKQLFSSKTILRTLLTLGFFVHASTALSSSIELFLVEKNAVKKSQHLTDIREALIEKFVKDRVAVNYKAYVVDDPKVNVLFKLNDDTCLSLKAGQKRIVLAEGQYGRDTLEYLKEHSVQGQDKKFSGILLATDVLKDPVRWLSYDQKIPDTIILPQDKVTDAYKTGIPAMSARLIEFDAKKFSAAAIATEIYKIYK